MIKMTNDRFWTNRVKTFKINSFEEIEKTLNEFYKDKFIIATQIFSVGIEWFVVIYYKTAPDKQ